MSVNNIGSLGPAAADNNRQVTSCDNGDFSGILDNCCQPSQIDLDTIFEAAAKMYNIPVNLLKSVAKAESSFIPDATSPCGAMGIMQLMPATAKSLGVTDAYDPVQNIMGGAKYLRQMLDEFDGNTELALAAYNAGPNNVEKYGGIPPFKETQNYVAKVMGYCGNDISAGYTPIHHTTAASTSEFLKNLLLTIKSDNGADMLARLLLLMFQSQLPDSLGETTDFIV